MVRGDRLWTLGAFVPLGLLGWLSFQFLVQKSFPSAAFLLCVAGLVSALVLPSILVRGFKDLAELRDQLTWWHGLWLLMFLSTLVFRMRDAQAIREVALDAWGAYRVVLVAITGIVLALRLVLRQTEWVSSLFDGLPSALTVYCIVCVASTAWSVYPAWTIYKSVEYFVLVALVAAVVVSARSATEFKSLFDLTWILCGLLLSAVWLGALLWPQESLKRGVGLLGVQLYGVLPILHANTVGELSAILAVVALARLLAVNSSAPHRRTFAVLLAASLPTLILSQTRSAIMGFLLGAAMLLLLSGRKAVLAITICSVALLLPLTNASGAFRSYFLRGQDPEVFRSLSGRTGWWDFTAQKLLDRPLTGYGAYAGGRFAVLEESGSPLTASVHNTYVEVLAGTSFWGLIPVVIALLATWWVLARELRRLPAFSIERQIAAEALAVLAVITVRSFLTSHLIWNNSLIFLMVLGYAEYLRRRRKSQRDLRRNESALFLSTRRAG